MAEVDKHQLLSRSFLQNNAEYDAVCNTENVNNYVPTSKRYLVYMELPKIKIGDYHKPSCIVGNILRFHFLMKIAENENEHLTLQPIKVYKVPVVNVAVIHRPFIEDDIAKGPIPKSPDVKSPLICYNEEREESKESEGRGNEITETQENEKLEEDFRKGSASEQQQQQEQPTGHEAEADDVQEPQLQDSGKHRHGGKKRKKYFVYCELPKVAIGDYRISSVTSSELIHCHFLMKIAKDESHGQPALRPIKKYRRPRVNFAVIHRSLIVDDEAAGPIPRSPGVKSPMIREDMDGDDEDMDMLHTSMGFDYGAPPSRSKYELVSQWSLVADESGRIVPELVLSKAN